MQTQPTTEWQVECGVSGYLDMWHTPASPTHGWLAVEGLLIHEGSYMHINHIICRKVDMPLQRVSIHQSFNT